jgi:hypothetical protein
MNTVATKLVILVVAIVLLCVNKASASDMRFSKDIDLGDACGLLLRETKEEAVVVLLRCAGKEDNEVRVQWAGIRDEDVQRVIFKGGISAYFITAWDRSSTYGAQTNVVVWKGKKGWRIVKAPFVRGFVEDANKDGVYEIIDYYPKEVTYSFKDGKFPEVKEAPK